MYNIHPIFVHFPIAFLLLYSLLVVLPLSKWIPSVSWRPIERLILVVGVLGAMIASQTGEVAEHLVRPDRSLVEMHALFAGLSTWLYGILLAGEAVHFIHTRYAFIFEKIRIGMVIIRFCEKVLMNRMIVVLCAILGAIAILVTGLLGGVMVYGMTADPLAPIILSLLGITL